MTQTTPTPKLSLRQQAALMATQSLLEAGLLAHKSDDDDTEAPNNACFFNMNYWIEDTRNVDYTEEEDENGDTVVKHCGSFMCIGGTTEWLLGRTQFAGESSLMAVAEEDPGLYDLFYPGQTNRLGKPESEIIAVARYNWDNINPQHAAKAIENYRTYGDPKWYEVLGLDRE